MSAETEGCAPLKQSVNFASELILPGGSNLVSGDIKQGALHAVLGLVAKSVFGLPGLIAVSANSFTKATTGRHLHEHLGLGATPREQAEAKTPDNAQPDTQADASYQPAPPPVRRPARKRQASSKRKTET